ncbi:ITGAV, partial [Cervus elaphus hippelaphus]
LALTLLKDIECINIFNCLKISYVVGNRDYAKDDPLEFKSHQWFGASVRSKQDKILKILMLMDRDFVKEDSALILLKLTECFLAVLVVFTGKDYNIIYNKVTQWLSEISTVYIYDGKNMSSLHNFTGEQMAAYFGFSVAATDINGDDYADVFIGAPLFMDRGSDGKLQEVGQVSVSLQKASGDFQTIKLNGFEVFARFGSAIAPLGDLDQDGFNDIAIAAPYGGEDKKGIVYIFNGRPTGLNAVPSQILEGKWAARSMPPSFGYSMKGATDIDKNGYPDFQVELLLDKLKQKGAIRRALFLHNRSPGHSKNMTISRGGQMQCEELIAYLRLTLTCLKTGSHDPFCIQAHILLDCGDDNVCKPKLEVSVDSDQKKIYVGDDNPLTLIVKAQNQGEGAYEAELIVSIPLQADFIGVVRNSEALARLSCAFKTENQTRQVVCDLGNPMKAGTQLRNKGPSSFSKAMLHLQWPYKYNNNTLLYILQYDIDGPMNCTSDMEINPLRIKISNSQATEKNDTSGGQGDRNHLITKRDLTLSEGDVHTLGCGIAECLKIVCQVGRLDRGKSAILYVRSLLWTETFMNKENQNHSYSLKSSASFNVIEFPYKNLPIEDIFNST